MSPTTSGRGCTSLYYVVLFLCSALAGCGYGVAPKSGLSVLQSTPLVSNSMVGDATPVRDPSIAYQNGTYYLFSTDPANPSGSGYLAIRCSSDRMSWKPCGS